MFVKQLGQLCTCPHFVPMVLCDVTHLVSRRPPQLTNGYHLSDNLDKPRLTLCCTQTEDKVASPIILQCFGGRPVLPLRKLSHLFFAGSVQKSWSYQGTWVPDLR